MRSFRLPVVVIVIAAVLACLPAAAQVVTSTQGVANDPAGAVVNPNTNHIFVANDCGNDPSCGGNGSVTVINGSTLASQTVTVDDFPYPIAVNTATDVAYAATCSNDPTCATGSVSVINGSTLNFQSVPTGFFTDWVAVDSTRNMIYAVNECNDAQCSTMGTLTVINGSTLGTQSVPVGAEAWSVSVDTTHNVIYVVNNCGSDLTCQSQGSVTVINGNTLQVVGTVATDYYPEFAAVDPVHNMIYVPNNGGSDGTGLNGTVTIINGSTLQTQTVNVQTFPTPVILNSTTNTIYVGNRCGADPNCIQPPTVSVINGNTLAVNNVSICSMETFPADNLGIDLTTNQIYFPCQGRSSQNTTGLRVTVLDGNSGINTFPIAVGDYPNAAAVNSTTNTIYVPNQGDNTVSVIGGATELQLNNVTPCRLVDTRTVNGGGGPIQGGTFQSFNLPQLSQQKGCGSLASAASYSLNVTLVPYQGHPVGYLTIWPASQLPPYVSTMNSDGRFKANAAIVGAGVSGEVSVFVSDTADVVLDIDGYFGPSGQSTLQFYPLAPCRVANTGDPSEPQGLGPPSLSGGTVRNFPVLEATNCFQQVPPGVTPAAYSFNFTAVPQGPLYYLTVWPEGEPQPYVSTLNAPTGTATANAALVPAGTGGGISAFASNNTDLIIDINGYFAAPADGGLSLYPATPCRVYDSRNNGGQPFSGERTVNVVGSPCALPSSAQGYVFNATVVPSGALGYLTLWPDCQGQDCPGQPYVSTLNAWDGVTASNMAIVPNVDGFTDAYASNPTQLILDISGFFAP
jgi:DNA-binding beta-propeller fold protein YncE